MTEAVTQPRPIPHRHLFRADTVTLIIAIKARSNALPVALKLRGCRLRHLYNQLTPLPAAFALSKSCAVTIILASRALRNESLSLSQYRTSSIIATVPRTAKLTRQQRMRGAGCGVKDRHVGDLEPHVHDVTNSWGLCYYWLPQRPPPVWRRTEI